MRKDIIIDNLPPPLSIDQEEFLFNQVKLGNLSAKNVIVERNLRMVAHIAIKYMMGYIDDYNDLFSVGCIGLIKGVSSFQADKGTRLATYAARCIENEILMYLRSEKKYMNEISLQTIIGLDEDENEITLAENICNNDFSLENTVDTKYEILLLYNKLKNILNGKERLVVELKYGIIDGIEMKQCHIANILKVSESYVSKINKKALEKLKGELINSEYR